MQVTVGFETTLHQEKSRKALFQSRPLSLTVHFQIFVIRDSRPRGPIDGARQAMTRAKKHFVVLETINGSLVGRVGVDESSKSSTGHGKLLEQRSSKGARTRRVDA